ncbi:hypothetical protein QBC47DRAFT_373548 [Echria macrotheca]|uniref:Uncharacterized protein n=1 Tax=Echria macrotheca TaxID=438768 RepID=A0AAJ0FEC0_9PEZI|nr:hypothetical protein QBC47DRAFT_373548 [Echria macrotheca]
MGSSQSSLSNPAGTSFVSSEQLPCLVVGDSSLYGVGIRTSYYLQYVAALLSVLFLHSQDQKLWFLSFVPLAAANLVVLSLNATGGGLVVLDWAIVFGLVFWSVVFLAWSVVQGALRDSPGGVADVKQVQQNLEREGGRMVSDQEAEWDTRYIEVLRVLGTAEQTDCSGALWRSISNKQDVLERALQDYVAAFTSVRSMPAATDAASYIIDLYADGRIRDIAARMMVDNKQVESFRDTHTEALRRSHIPFDQAQVTTQALGRIAKEGSRSPDQRRSPWHLFRSVGRHTVAMGLISCGLGLLLYSGFVVFMVWLLFRGVNHGATHGCDVRLIFIFVPVSAYSRGAMTGLKVLACIWLAVVGMPALLFGLALLGLGATNWWLGSPARRPPPTALGPKTGPAATDLRTVPYDAEKGKETEVASPATMTRFSRASELYEMDEFAQPSSAAARDTLGSSYYDFLLKEAAAAGNPGTTAAGTVSGIRGGQMVHGRTPRLGSLLPRLRWEYLLVLPVAHTAAVVEMTIRLNHMQMRQRAMTSMAELVAFFLGAFVFLRVVTRCLREAVRRIRRRQSAGWFDERWKILGAPATRLDDVGAVVGGSFYHGGYVGGGALGREISVGESSFGKETEMSESASAARSKARRIYMQPERRSGSSMGKFKEMIDEDE